MTKQKQSIEAQEEFAEEVQVEEAVIIEEPKVKSKEIKMEKLTIQDLPGVGAATAEKLEAAGYRDLMSIAVATLGQLAETAGVSEAVGRKMINAARDSMKMGFETGMEVLKKRELVVKISTGSQRNV